MMKELEIFDEKQIVTVNHIVGLAEDIVSEYFKMSSTQWLRNRYDVMTLSQLSEAEIVYGPYAQIVRYSGKKKETHLGSGVFDFYKICLQDHSIIRALRENKELELDPFLLYIITHELIHIIRFGQFIQFFDASVDERSREEDLVHRRTVDVLKKITMNGIRDVFNFYGVY